jgi:hypothetical protein
MPIPSSRELDLGCGIRSVSRLSRNMIDTPFFAPSNGKIGLRALSPVASALIASKKFAPAFAINPMRNVDRQIRHAARTPNWRLSISLARRQTDRKLTDNRELPCDAAAIVVGRSASSDTDSRSTGSVRRHASENTKPTHSSDDRA